MYLNSILGACIASVSLVVAETIVIKAENLDFQPANVNASAGDILEFHFGPNNHSVVMGDMDNPCQPASDGGFYSGFLPVSSGESVSAAEEWWSVLWHECEQSRQVLTCQLYRRSRCSGSRSMTQIQWCTTARRTDHPTTTARAA